MKTTWPPPLSRDAFSGHFLRVCAQLDALQPPARSTAESRAPQADADDLASAMNPSGDRNPHDRLLPTRGRVAEILQHNQRFYPPEETQPRRRPGHAAASASVASPSAKTGRVMVSNQRRDSTDVPTTPYVASTVSDGPLRNSPQAPPSVLAPVGGRARVFQWKELTRAKRSMKKRSHALTNLQAAAATLSGKPGSSGGSGGPGGLFDTSSPIGGSAMSGKQALISELVRHTNFSTQHIFHLSRKFKEIAGTSKSVISFAEFRQILSDDVAALLQAIGVGADEFAELEQTDMRCISATISTSESFLRRLFVMFDGDGDGKIDFREFVVGLNGFVKGSLEDKVDALFDVYQPHMQTGETTPTSADEYGEQAEPHIEQQPAKEMTVAISDLLGLFQGDRQLYQELMRCVDEYFVRVGGQDDEDDGDSDGQQEEVTVINREDFVTVSLAEPSLLEAISRPTPSLVFSEDAALRERLKAFVDRRGLRWRTMLAIQRRVLQSQASHHISATAASAVAAPAIDMRMPIAKFLQLLTLSFSPDSVSASKVDGIDDHEDLSLLLRPYMIKSGHGFTSSLGLASSSPPPTPTLTLLDVPTFLMDLAVVLLHPTTVSTADTAADAEAKARFHFELFDLNGDGLISRTELVSAVCAGFAHFGPHLTDVVRVLESEDADHDGELTKEQYLRAAHRSPLIMASLYTCI